MLVLQLAAPWHLSQTNGAVHILLLALDEKAYSTQPNQTAVAGLPPTWARKKDAVHILQRALEEKYGQDYRPEHLPLWRRKLLFHQSGNRSHAFYGSFSKPR